MGTRRTPRPGVGKTTEKGPLLWCILGIIWFNSLLLGGLSLRGGLLDYLRFFLRWAEVYLRFEECWGLSLTVNFLECLLF